VTAAQVLNRAAHALPFKLVLGHSVREQ
jgi:hypothetical protein